MSSVLLRQILSLVILLPLVFAQEVTFTGREYAGIYLRSILWDDRRNFLQLRFRTLHENGVLVFSRGKDDKTNYFRLELKKGSLRFSSRLGGNHVTNIALGSDLADGKWHSVTVKPTRRQTQITLDSYPRTELTGEGYNVNSLDGTLFVADLGKRQTRNRFRGCLADVTFDGSNILREAFKRRFPHITYMGSFIKRCVYDDYSYNLATFTSPNWFMKVALLKNSKSERSFSTSLQFRTYIKEGLFLSATTLNHEVQLRLEFGSLLLSIELSNGYKKQLKVGRNLNDGEWHTVQGGVYRTHISISVDQRSRTKKINFKDTNVIEFFNRLRSNVLAGKGFQNKYQGFVGCLFNFTVNNHKIIKKDLESSKQHSGLRLGVCSIKNRCYPNPCKNGGQCENRYKAIYCNCSTTEYEGNTCEDTIYKETCAEYRHIGLKDNSNCKLKGQDSKNVYTALCNITDAKDTYTIIDHMRMGKKSVREDVTNNIGYLTHEIKYPVGMDQIEALIQNSEHCRQFVRYDCFSSILIGPPWSQARMSWLSRDGKTQTHWGGADPGSHMCACGKMNNCSDPYKHCNCDKNDNVWRYDEGYFTSKDLLPVTKLQFSKQGFKSYFTLGPLECWSSLQKIVGTSRNGLLSRACNPVPSPTSPPTNKYPRTRSKTTSTPCDAAGNASRYCSLTDDIHRTTTEKQSTQRLFYPHLVAKTESKTKSKRVASVYENRKKQNSSALEEFRLSLTAIVLISCVLVVFLLVVIRYQLPSMLVCARKLNRRGEATFSIVPPREQMM